MRGEQGSMRIDDSSGYCVIQADLKNRGDSVDPGGGGGGETDDVKEVEMA